MSLPLIRCLDLLGFVSLFVFRRGFPVVKVCQSSNQPPGGNEKSLAIVMVTKTGLGGTRMLAPHFLNMREHNGCIKAGRR